jgi:hypothetical protein
MKIWEDRRKIGAVRYEDGELDAACMEEMKNLLQKFS